MWCYTQDNGASEVCRQYASKCSCIQWNPSCEATPFASEKWPFKRDGLSSGTEINTFMFRLTLSIGLSKGCGLSSGWSLERGSTIHVCVSLLWECMCICVHVFICMSSCICRYNTHMTIAAHHHITGNMILIWE